MLSLLLKSLGGAATVLLIALLSRGRNVYLAGLVPLFPTFALIAHAIVGSERGPVELRSTAIFGLWSLLPYAVYLLAVCWLCSRYSLLLTLSAATLGWLLAAGLLLLGWSRWTT
jgi:membrane protein GlpM